MLEAQGQDFTSPTLGVENMQEQSYQNLTTVDESWGENSPTLQPPTNYGYELTAFITALLLVVGVGLLPALVDGNIKQLPFGVIGVAFVMGALLAYHHQHHGRFWLFIVASVFMTVGGVK